MRLFALCSKMVALGVALPMSAAAQQPKLVATRGAAHLRGTAFDSLAMRPLVGAVVEVASVRDVLTSWRTTSDAAGTWHFDSLPGGDYIIAFTHPALDSLALDVPPIRAAATDDDSTRVELAVPSARAVIAATCRGAADTTGLVLSAVRSAAGGAAMPQAIVAAQWSDVVKVNGMLQLASPAVVSRADAEGMVALCGVPRERPLRVRAWRGEDSSGVVTLDVPMDGILRHDLFIAAPGIGTHTVSGIVRNAERRPLAGATIAMRELGNVTADEEGRWSMSRVPSGSRMIDVRAVGHESQIHVLPLMTGRDTTVEITLFKAGTSLSKVKVLGVRDRIDGHRGDFRKHQASGMGVFFDEKALVERNASFLSDVIRTVPGVMVRSGRSSSGADSLVMKAMGVTGECAPQVFIDGTRLTTNAALDRVVSMVDVIGIEIYTRTSEIPLEFQTRSHCGVIAIWTGRRRPGG